MLKLQDYNNSQNFNIECRWFYSKELNTRITERANIHTNITENISVLDVKNYKNIFTIESRNKFSYIYFNSKNTSIHLIIFTMK